MSDTPTVTVTLSSDDALRAQVELVVAVLGDIRDRLGAPSAPADETGLDARIAALEARLVPPDLTDQVAALAGRLAALEQRPDPTARVAALEARPVVADPTQQLGDITKRLASLESQPYLTAR